MVSISVLLLSNLTRPQRINWWATKKISISIWFFWESAVQNGTIQNWALHKLEFVFFIFTSKIGEDEPIVDEHFFFQRGWFKPPIREWCKIPWNENLETKNTIVNMFQDFSPLQVAESLVGAEGIELLVKSFHQVLLSLQALGRKQFVWWEVKGPTRYTPKCHPLPSKKGLLMGWCWLIIP